MGPDWESGSVSRQYCQSESPNPSAIDNREIAVTTDATPALVWLGDQGLVIDKGCRDQGCVRGVDIEG